MLTGRIDTPGSKLAFLLAVATVPVIVVGLILQVTGLADAMRSVTVIGWTMLIFGHRPLLGRISAGRRTKRDGDWSFARRDQHGALAGGRADPRHVAVGHHDHGGPDAGLRQGIGPRGSPC